MKSGLCSFYGKYFKNLKSHLMQQHYKKEIPCEQCEKLFKSKVNKREHEKNVYGEDISCLSRKKKFASKNYFKKHQKVVHLKENKLICCYCDKTFDFKHSLKNHQKHSCKEKFDKTVQCSKCEKSLTDKRSLRKHMKSIHQSVQYLY